MYYYAINIELPSKFHFGKPVQLTIIHNIMSLNNA